VLLPNPPCWRFLAGPGLGAKSSGSPSFPDFGDAFACTGVRRKGARAHLFSSVPGGERVGKSEAEARKGETPDPTHSQETSANIPRRDPCAPARNTGGGVMVARESYVFAPEFSSKQKLSLDAFRGAYESMYVSEEVSKSKDPHMTFWQICNFLTLSLEFRMLRG